MLFFYYCSFCEQSLQLEFKVGDSSVSAPMSIIWWIKPQIWMFISFHVNEDLREKVKMKLINKNLVSKEC